MIIRSAAPAFSNPTSSDFPDFLPRRNETTNESPSPSTSPPSQSTSEVDLDRLKQEGLALLERELYKPAQQKFLQAYKEGARDASTYYYIGLTSFHLGENEKAVEALTLSLEQNPSSLESRYYRANSYGGLGNYQAAFDDYSSPELNFLLLLLSVYHFALASNSSIILTHCCSLSQNIVMIFVSHLKIQALLTHL